VPVLSFSHFVPRPELYRGRGDLGCVMGSLELQAQVEALAPALHVFGHSHLDVDACVGGCRFVQHALGSPQERAWSSFGGQGSGEAKLPKRVWP